MVALFREQYAGLWSDAGGGVLGERRRHFGFGYDVAAMVVARRRCWNVAGSGRRTVAAGRVVNGGASCCRWTVRITIGWKAVVVGRC